MSDASARAKWAIAAEVGAWIINSNPFRTGEPVTAEQLNPMSVPQRSDESPARELSMSELFKMTGEM